MQQLQHLYLPPKRGAYNRTLQVAQGLDVAVEILVVACVPSQCPASLVARAQHRFGKSKTVDDWIPDDAVRPSNVGGLVDKAIREAEEMLKKTEGLSGTLADLVKCHSVTTSDTVTQSWEPDPQFVDPTAKLVEPHTRDMSDLTGLPQEICDLTGLSAEVVGHADIVSEEAGDICGSQDRPDLPIATVDGDDELEIGPAGAATEHCLGCGRSMPADSGYVFCARCG